MNSQAQSTPDYNSQQPTSPSSSSRAFAKARRTRHRVDAGEPRSTGCFNSPPQHQHYFNSSQRIYPMKMLQEFITPNQLLLREMLQRKQGYEEECGPGPRINGCKKRKLYQPQRTDFEIEDLSENELEQDETSLPRELSSAASAGPTSAPLTRQLLTERHQSSPPPRERDRDRDRVRTPTPSSPPHYLHQWKESFKNQLISNISDLVDKQFEILLFPKQQQNLHLHHLHHQSLAQQHQAAVLAATAVQQSQHNNSNSIHNNNNNSNSINKNGLNNNNNNINCTNNNNNTHERRSPILAETITPKVFNGGSVEAFSNFHFQPKTDFSSALANLAHSQHRDLDDLEPLSLVVTPKKKRHKVTDSRLTPRAVSKLLSDLTPSPCPSPTQLPTTVAIPNPSLPLFTPYAPLIYQRNSPEYGQPPSSGSEETNSFDYTPGHSSTLTPMHLRKAKLMFFWVRYPSSSVLKMYFPDIKFNKNNTAQLVKWFSNFREFYYIQMEKYARQAISEGVKNADDLHVSVDHELYRVLNLHYNRNNTLEVPTNFRYVVEQTLREFFKSIQTGKDQEQSWKKAIYKIIARLDDPVPDYFKSPNFLEQLE